MAEIRVGIPMLSYKEILQNPWMCLGQVGEVPGCSEAV